jgi:Rrf2 family nitric oxide-sensitive transcriptional repressor
MFTKTSISAIRTLTYLGLQDRQSVFSPRTIAESLGESPSYLAKVARLLVKAGILEAQRGVAGGVRLNRPPAEIALLSIVEACQGVILGNFCSETPDLRKTCAFHQAGAELHSAIVEVMSRWTLQDFIQKPSPDNSLKGKVCCWLTPQINPTKRTDFDKKKR